MDRVNPRLFDLAFWSGVFFILPTLPKKRRPLPLFFKLYTGVILTFTFCAILWAAFLVPFYYGKYSLFFAYKYLTTVVLGYILLNLPLSAEQKRRALFAFILSGIFVSIYCFFEYMAPLPKVIKLAEGKFLVVNSKVLYGPLGASYHYLSIFSSYLFIFNFIYASLSKGFWSKFIFFFLAILTGWPAAFSGSRTGLLFFPTAILFSFFFIPKKIRTYTILLTSIFAILIYSYRQVIFDPTKNKTIDRILHTEKKLLEEDVEAEINENSALSRFLIITKFSFSEYKFPYLTPIIGAGFYIAPVKTPFGDYFYRVGYGFHHGYLIVLEQGGVIAFVIFLFYLVFLFRRLFFVYRESTVSIDKYFAISAICILSTWMIVELFQSLYWINAATYNSHQFIMTIYFLATTFSREHWINKQGGTRGDALSRKRSAGIPFKRKAR